MVGVDVGVAHGVDQGLRDQVTGVGEHVSEEGVGGDVERNTEAHVARALVEEAREVTFAVGFLVVAGGGS